MSIAADLREDAAAALAFAVELEEHASHLYWRAAQVRVSDRLRVVASGARRIAGRLERAAESVELAEADTLVSGIQVDEP